MVGGFVKSIFRLSIPMTTGQSMNCSEFTPFANVNAIVFGPSCRLVSVPAAPLTVEWVYGSATFPGVTARAVPYVTLFALNVKSGTPPGQFDALGQVPFGKIS